MVMQQKMKWKKGQKLYQVRHQYLWGNTWHTSKSHPINNATQANTYVGQTESMVNTSVAFCHVDWFQSLSCFLRADQSGYSSTSFSSTMREVQISGVMGTFVRAGRARSMRHTSYNKIIHRISAVLTTGTWWHLSAQWTVMSGIWVVPVSERLSVYM